MNSLVFLPITALAVFVAARKGGLYYLILLDLAMTLVLHDDWALAGVFIDPTDLVVAGIAYLAISGRDPVLRRPLRILPGFYVWVMLGMAISISYLYVPMNAERLTDPVRIVYQLYRYCWRPILFYPLTMLVVLQDEERAAGIVKLVIGLGIVTSIAAFYSMTLHTRELGFFAGKNILAGALVAPSILALGAVLGSRSSRARLKAMASLGIISLALLMSGSRGGVVAAAGGFATLTMPLARFAGGRARLIRLGIVAAFAGVIALAAVPSVDHLPGMDQLSELSKGTQVDNLRWRMQLRWPYFWAKATQHPWIGIGSDRDITLAEGANTPHNGYLSLALLYGFPAAFLRLLIAFRSIRNGWRSFLMRRVTLGGRFLGLSTAAAVSGILIHNLVESTIPNEYVGKLLLISAGIAAVSRTFAVGLQSAESGAAPARTVSARRERLRLAAAHRRV